MPPQQGHKCLQAEAKIQEALEAICLGSVPSTNAAEKKFSISRVLLCRRLKGTQMARHEVHKAEQLLILQEEQALVQWCRQLTIAGYPAVTGQGIQRMNDKDS